MSNNNMPPLSLSVSIVVTNYNYGDRLAAAIDSALAVEWPEKEVIVVDDGSTDHSPAVIKGYGDRIKAILKANGGQNTAANAGFAQSSGAIVFFLDADDTLVPDAAHRVTAVFGATTAKVQFPLRVVRADGANGGLYPRFPRGYAPSDVRKSIALTGFYISSPTSGNAWPRWVLEQAFPLPTKWSDAVPADYFDGYLSCIAAQLGDIVTLNDALGTYYVNPNNMWTRQFSPKLIAQRCEEDFAQTAYVNAKLGAMRLPPIGNRGFTHWMKRLVYRKYFRDSYPISERFSALLLQSLHSAMIDPGLATKHRVLIMGWMIAVAALPGRWALPLIRLRYVPSSRPRSIRSLLA